MPKEGGAAAIVENEAVRMKNPKAIETMRNAVANAYVLPSMALSWRMTAYAAVSRSRYCAGWVNVLVWVGVGGGVTDRDDVIVKSLEPVGVREG